MKCRNKFRVGDIITMGEEGKRHISIYNEQVSYSGKGCNPWGISGVVIEVNDLEEALPVRVLWNNGRNNYYEHNDLEYFNLSLENK
jgi:hypothetical protein